MKTLLKVLAFGAMLGASAQLAYASPILPNGSTLHICCSGIVTMTGSGSSAGLSFTNPEPTSSGTGGLQNYTSVILSNTFTFAGINPGAGEMLFVSTAGGNTLQFFVTGYTSAGNILTFTGYLTLNGVAGTNATLKEALGNPGPGNVGNYYEGYLTTTPEPSSLVLLGTGLAGAAGLMLRRRKVVSA